MDGLKQPDLMRANRVDWALRANGCAHFWTPAARAEKKPIHGTQALPRSFHHLLDCAIGRQADRPFLPRPDHLPRVQRRAQRIVMDMDQACAQARAHEVVVDDRIDILIIAEREKALGTLAEDERQKAALLTERVLLVPADAIQL